MASLASSSIGNQNILNMDYQLPRPVCESQGQRNMLQVVENTPQRIEAGQQYSQTTTQGITVFQNPNAVQIQGETTFVGVISQRCALVNARELIIEGRDDQEREYLSKIVHQDSINLPEALQGDTNLSKYEENALNGRDGTEFARFYSVSDKIQHLELFRADNFLGWLGDCVDRNHDFEEQLQARIARYVLYNRFTVELGILPNLREIPRVRRASK